jgi:hypothetical protein
MAIKRPAIAAGIELFRAWLNDETARPADGQPSLVARGTTPAAHNRVKVFPHGAPAKAFSFDQLAGTSAYLLARTGPDVQSADKKSHWTRGSYSHLHDASISRESELPTVKAPP